MTQGSISEIQVAIDRLKKDYDQLPYIYQISTYSHPETLACAAFLNGFNCTPPRNAKILELACGRGVNLTAIAHSLPGSECVGIDLSHRHIEDCNDLALQLGVDNVQFRQLDLMDISAGFGKFDYILINGAYSWVPPQVQNQILKICAENRTDNGISMIHYATYPGSTGSEAIRKMMSYHLNHFMDPKERFDQALDFISFFSEASPKTNPFANFLEGVNQGPESTKINFYHESLGVESTPCYFHELIDKADQHSLKYLTEVDVDGGYQQLSEKARNQLKQIPDLTRREQYLDFFINRGTRTSIFCHKSRAPVTKEPQVSNIRHKEIFLSGVIREAANAEEGKADLPANSITFENPLGLRITPKTEQLTSALKRVMQAWPKAVRLDVLLQSDAGNHDSHLIKDLLDCCRIGLCSMRLSQVCCETTVTERPTLYPLAKIQAGNKDQNLGLTNTRHETVNLDLFELLLAEYLDGTRSQGDLVKIVSNFADQKKITLHRENKPITDQHEILAAITKKVQKSLENLANYALLVESS